MFAPHRQRVVSAVLIAAMAFTGVARGNLANRCCCPRSESGGCCCCQRGCKPAPAKKATCPHCQQQEVSRAGDQQASRPKCRCGCSELPPPLPVFRVTTSHHSDELLVDTTTPAVASIADRLDGSACIDAIEPLARGPSLQRLHCIWRL